MFSWAFMVGLSLIHICIPGAKNIAAFDVFAYIVYPWFMVLLFVVAGMCARYSLQKCTDKEFIKRRATKLLVHSTLGLFVIQMCIRDRKYGVDFERGLPQFIAALDLK